MTITWFKQFLNDWKVILNLALEYSYQFKSIYILYTTIIFNLDLLILALFINRSLISCPAVYYNVLLNKTYKGCPKKYKIVLTDWN